MDDVQANLSYFAEHSCSEQWRVFVSEMVGEFYDQVDRELAASFLTRVGTRMAQSMPLPECASLEDVETAINAILARIRWGWIRLEEAGRHIKVTHGAYPVVPMYQSAPEAWLVPFLEGVFTEWLNSLGGNTDFRALSTSTPANVWEPIEFLYGNHS